MKRLLLTILLLCIPAYVCAEPPSEVAILNPYTGKFDFVKNLTTSGTNVFYKGLPINSSASGNFSGLTLSADSGASEDITNGDEITFSGGTNISTVVGATDTVTIALDDNVDLAGTLTVDGSVYLGQEIVYVDTSDSVQDAINSLPASGGVIYLLPGTHTSSKITINKDNVTIEGSGRPSILKLANSSDSTLLEFASGSADCVVKNIEIDGNKANQTATNSAHLINTGWYCHRLKVQNCYIHDSIANAVNWAGSDYVEVSNCVIVDAGKSGVTATSNGFGIAWNSSKSARISNTVVINPLSSGIFCSGTNPSACSDVLINNVEVSGVITDQQSCIHLYQVDGFNISNSNLHDTAATANGVNGIYVRSVDGGSDLQGVISTINIDGVTGTGIELQDSAVTISNLYLTQSGSATTAQGIYISGSDVVVNNFQINNAPNHGIYIAENRSELNLSNGIIKNSQNGSGLRFVNDTGEVTKAIISNVGFIDDQPSATQAYGIQATGTGTFPDVKIYGCYFDGNASGEISGVPYADVQFDSNVDIKGQLTVDGDWWLGTTLTESGGTAYYKGTEIGTGSGSSVWTDNGTTITPTDGEDVLLNSDLTINKTGIAAITLKSSSTRIPAIYWMRDGDVYYDYLDKVDSGYKQTLVSADDGDTWELLYQFKDDSFIYNILKSLEVDQDITGQGVLFVDQVQGYSSSTGPIVLDGQGAGTYIEDGDVGITDDLTVIGNVTVTGGVWAEGVKLGAAGGASDHGALTGLSDDDHPQYVLNSSETTDVDLPVNLTVDGYFYETRPIRDVRTWGAYGDGVTDDTTAIQNALDDAGVIGGTVFIPEGIYICSALTVSNNTIVRGVRGDVYTGTGTILKLKDGTNDSLINFDTPAGTVNRRIQLRDFAIDGNATNQSGTSHGIEANRPGFCLFDNLEIRYALSDGLRLGDSGQLSYHNTIRNVYSMDSGKAGIRIVNSEENKLIGCHTSATNYAATGDAGYSINANGNMLVDCATVDDLGVGIYIGARATMISNCMIDQARREGILIASNNENSIVGCTLLRTSYTSDDTYSAIRVVGGTANKFIGNFIDGAYHKYGIELQTTSDYTTIIGNDVRDYYSGRSGVLVVGSNNTVVGNKGYGSGVLTENLSMTGDLTVSSRIWSGDSAIANDSTKVATHNAVYDFCETTQDYLKTSENDDDAASLANIQTALSNDFHNVGGTDDDVPDAGDFGNATDLDSNGALLPNTVGLLEISSDVTAAVTNGAATLVTGDQVYDFCETTQDYLPTSHNVWTKGGSGQEAFFNLSLGVGIGVTAPQTKLDVDGDVTMSGLLTVSGIQMTSDSEMATVLSPSDVVANGQDKPCIWVNDTGVTVYIHNIEGWAWGYDDTAFTLLEVDNDGVSNETTIEAVNCTTGTGPYTADVDKGLIDHRTIEDGHMVLLDMDATDDPSKLTVKFKWKTISSE